MNPYPPDMLLEEEEPAVQPAGTGPRCRLPSAPPPRTRSSSPMPVEKRISALSPSSVTGRALGAATAREEAMLLPFPFTGDSGRSTTVVHAPQAGQRPAHFGVSFPHSVQ